MKLSNLLPGFFLHLTEAFVKMFSLVQYLAEGFARIFSPNEEEYPEIGVQPFDSEPYAAHK